MIRKPYIFILFLSVLLTACSGGGGSDSQPTTPPATLSSISVSISGDATEYIAGVQYTGTAVGTFSDGQSSTLTNVSWTSSDTQVATVSSTGIILGASPGTTTLTATSGGVSAQLAVTILAPSVTGIEVVANDTQIPLGQTLQLTARASLNNGTNSTIDNAVWTSSTPQTAEVSAQGLLTSLAIGTTTITAASDDFSATLIITVTAAELVSINIQINDASIANGTTAQLTALGQFSDSTTTPVNVTWSSDDEQIATIDTNGVLTGVGIGQTNASATSGDITSNSVSVTITDAIIVGLEAVQTFTDLPLGSQETITATLQFSDNSTQPSTSVTWSSSDESIATITQNGTQDIVQAVGVGNATITATDGAFSNTFNLTVGAAVVTSIDFSDASLTIPNGASDNVSVTATFSDNTTNDVTDTSTFTLSDTSIASLAPVSNSLLTVTGTAVGNGSLSAQFNDLNASIDIAITDAVATQLVTSAQTLSVAKGVSNDISMSVEYSDGSNVDPISGVAWSVADNSVASISTTGNNTATITGVETGTTTATAEIDGLSLIFTITVTAAEPLSLAFTANDIHVDDAPVNLVANMTFTDNSMQVVTDQVMWESSDATVATISNANGNEGLLTPVAEGNVTVTATFTGTTISTSQTFTVLPARFESGFEMVEFNVNPLLTIGSGDNQIQFTIGTVDGQSVTLTGSTGVTIGLASSNSMAGISDASAISLTGQAVTLTQNSSQSIVVAKNSNDVYAVIQLHHVEPFDSGADGDLAFLSWAIRTDSDVDFSPYYVAQEIKFFICRDTQANVNGSCSVSALPASSTTSGSRTQNPLPDAFTISTFVAISIGKDALVTNLSPEFDANVTAAYIDGLVNNETIPNGHGVTFRMKVPPTGNVIVNNFFRLEIDGLSFSLSSEFLSN